MAKSDLEVPIRTYQFAVTVTKVGDIGATYHAVVKVDGVATACGEAEAKDAEVAITRAVRRAVYELRRPPKQSSMFDQEDEDGGHT